MSIDSLFTDGQASPVLMVALGAVAVLVALSLLRLLQPDPPHDLDWWQYWPRPAARAPAAAGPSWTDSPHGTDSRGDNDERGNAQRTAQQRRTLRSQLREVRVLVRELADDATYRGRRARFDTLTGTIDGLKPQRP